MFRNLKKKCTSKGQEIITYMAMRPWLIGFTSMFTINDSAGGLTTQYTDFHYKLCKRLNKVCARQWEPSEQLQVVNFPARAVKGNRYAEEMEVSALGLESCLYFTRNNDKNGQSCLEGTKLKCLLCYFTHTTKKHTPITLNWFLVAWDKLWRYISPLNP